MSELVERLRARLRSNGNVQRQDANSGSKCSPSATDSGASASNVGQDGIAGFGASDFEGARADLRIACSIYLKARSQCYIDYQAAGIAVFEVLVGAGAGWLKDYCIEPYPDMCCCGHEVVSNQGGVRDHCPVCKGHNVKLAYDMQRLGQELEIHYSWIQYGFAYGLKMLGGIKR